MAEEREIDYWFTVNGVHIPVFKGETKKEAFDRKFKEGNSDNKDSQLKKSEAEAKRLNEEQKNESYEFKDAEDFNSFVKANIQYIRTSHRSMEDIKSEWHEKRRTTELQNLKEQNIEDSVDTVRDNIRSSVLNGWFREANSDYKPQLVDSILGNSGTLNAGLNIGYYNYRYQFERYSELYGKWIPHDGVDQSKKLSFKDWLNTPQTLYRGTHGQKTVASDIFSSYTPDKSMAMRFGTQIDTIQIKPIDTLGSYQTTGEQEFLVPVKWLKEHGK